jgi:hypothetical protein
MLPPEQAAELQAAERSAVDRKMSLGLLRAAS